MNDHGGRREVLARQLRAGVLFGPHVVLIIQDNYKGSVFCFL